MKFVFKDKPKAVLKAEKVVAPEESDAETGSESE